MNLILAGYRGCGKTTVGELLAARLGWRFVDLDALVATKAGKSIADIFAAEGEEGFRKRERDACDHLRKSRNQVIAFGGGTLLNPEDRPLIKRLGKVIWLRAPAAVLWRRISQDPRSSASRPPLTPTGGLAEVESVLRSRELAYETISAHVVDATTSSPVEIAEAIEMWFQANDSENT